MTESQATQLLDLTQSLLEHAQMTNNLLCTIICGLGFIAAIMFWQMIVKIIRDRQF